MALAIQPQLRGASGSESFAMILMLIMTGVVKPIPGKVPMVGQLVYPTFLSKTGVRLNLPQAYRLANQS